MKVGNKRGSTGVGTLILLTAAILVAGIAALALLRTAMSLQGKALLSGTRTKEQISVATQIVYMWAEDGTDPSSLHKVDQFFFKVRLQPGGKRINLNSTFLGADFELASADLMYNGLGEERRNCTNNGNVSESDFWTDPVTEKGNFSAVHLVKGNHYHDGYVNEGDLVLICFMAPYEIGESKPFGLRFIPKPGVATTFESETPDVINKKRVEIFPDRKNG